MQEELESVDLALTRMKSRFSDLSTVIGENESMAPLSAKISTPGGRHHAAKLTLYQQLSVVNMKACPKLQPVASNQILSAMIRSRELKQIREFGSLTTEMFVTTRATFALLVAFFEVTTMIRCIFSRKNLLTCFLFCSLKFGQQCFFARRH
jgi:hypothetical protein